MGQAMLNLLPLPNGVINQQAGQQFTSNDARDVTPLHTRKNFVIRDRHGARPDTALQRSRPVRP